MLSSFQRLVLKFIVLWIDMSAAGKIPRAAALRQDCIDALEAHD